MLRLSQKPACKSRGYSLVELLVVLGVIAILGLMSVPNLFGNNEKYSLDNSAKKIQQLLLEAKTRSIAPSKGESSGYSQIYQVSFGQFPSGSTGTGKVTAYGDVKTNTATLERGLASCGTGVSQGSLVSIRAIKLPRNVYVSSFYPTNQSTDDTTAAVRFSVGKVGFSCGKSTDPSIDSTQYDSGQWSGLTPTRPKTYAQFLIIEISSKRTTEKRYIAVDRLNGEVTVSKNNPQGAFDAFRDTYPPFWSGQVSDGKLNVTCKVETSDLVFSFPRAKDAADASDTLATSDPNRLVYYDIYWKVGSASNAFQPLVSKFFYGLDKDTVVYNLRSSAVTINNQPTPLVFRVWAFDAYNNYTTSRDFSFSNPTDWDCSNLNGGTGTSDKTSSDNDPLGIDTFKINRNPGTSDTNDGTGTGTDTYHHGGKMMDFLEF